MTLVAIGKLGIGANLECVRLAVLADREALGQIQLDLGVFVVPNQTTPDIREHGPERTPVHGSVRIERHDLPVGIERHGDCRHPSRCLLTPELPALRLASRCSHGHAGSHRRYRARRDRRPLEHLPACPHGRERRHARSSSASSFRCFTMLPISLTWIATPGDHLLGGEDLALAWAIQAQALSCRACRLRSDPRRSERYHVRHAPQMSQLPCCLRRLELAPFSSA